ncbi:hypothetical protein FWF74_00715 [Candidatus Saccharibacteria bacterium]|nr:hypothetical protein [Candidatus Saccharibacteria bacterium]MCL1963301.1 hypothetical protein [Candidatus Saccharibacteria bacterium]
MKINDLIKKLRVDFPEFNFEKSEHNFYLPTEKTIFYTGDAARLLHELGHGILDHKDFVQDIELIHIERDAWDKAREIAPKYGVEIDDSAVENALDDYRDWLHARSLCPKCRQTGVQSRENLNYYCVSCNTKWSANDARSCGLKRRLIKTKNHPVFQG